MKVRPTSFITRLAISWLLLALLLNVPTTLAQSAVKSIEIGVLAFQGADRAHKRWDAIAQYLTQQVDGHQFHIKTYDLEGMDRAVAYEDIDFVLTNPGNYVRLETLFGATRITTLSNLYKGRSYTIYGAVIFTREDRYDIRTLQDLSNKSFMAVSPKAFGGFQMAWYELSKRNIDPFADLNTLKFHGFPQDGIVEAVMRGEVDAGTVRAETLQRMIDEGKVDQDKIHILNERFANEYPFRHSTRLYPEWAFAKLKHADENLAQKIAVALLTQQSGSVTSRNSNINGWTIPLDYSRVHDTFRYLKIAPYDQDTEVDLSSVWQKYAHWILLTLLTLALLIAATIYVSRLNRHLSLSRSALEKEIEERKQAELELAKHSDLLEETVSLRTTELQAVNLELEQDIQARKEIEDTLRSSELALRRLYEITSAAWLDLNGKTSALLAFGREYFKLPKAELLILNDGIYQANHPVVNLKDTAEINLDAADFCYGLPIQAHGHAYGALCFTGQWQDGRQFNDVDQDILQLMAQWIGNEISRTQAEEQARQHQHELAHVARLGTMGEMASGMAHELNQPLTAIANYTRGCIRRLSGKDPDMPAIISAIEHSANEAERAAKIITRLRDFVSKGEVSRQDTDINKIIDMVVEITASDIRGHNVKLELHPGKNLPSIEVDHIQIEQVVLNLLRNSMDSLDVRDTDRRITVKTDRDNDFIVVSVADNGPGIKQDNIDHLFHPFYTTKNHGMGMGLSISRSIIEAHGGQLYLAKNDDGCVFEFIIPLPEADKLNTHG